MEWLTSIRKAIDYMEEHLEENISAQDVADQVFMSSFTAMKLPKVLQRLFRGSMELVHRRHGKALR